MKAVIKHVSGYWKELGIEVSEITPEAFDEGLANSKWHFEEGNEARITDGYWVVNIWDIFFEKEMHYSEYKNNYSDCETKRGSYNKETKTIIVYVQG